MEYISLRTMYYKNQNNISVWEDEYNKRFNDLFNEHLDIFIKQINRKHEYPAFFCYTKEMINLQSKIMSDFLNLKDLLSKIPSIGIEQFLYSCLIDEIKSSSDIEGVKSTRREIKNAIALQDKKDKTIRLWGIVNKYIKIINKENIPLKNCQDIRNLYDDFILDEIIQEDKNDKPDGLLFRKGTVSIGADFQKPTHEGVYPESKIIEYMDKALSILNNKNLSILIRISIFHYLFGYIHPFYDGNGRMSRFITSYCLAKTLDPTVALRLSLLIKQHKSQYYKLFEITNSEYNKGDLTPFIIWSLEFISFAIIDTEKELMRKYNMFKKLEEKLKMILTSSDSTLNMIYNSLLQSAIFSEMGSSLKEIAVLANKSERTIGTKLRSIPENYLIVDNTIRPYRYKLNLEVLK